MQRSSVCRGSHRPAAASPSQPQLTLGTALAASSMPPPATAVGDQAFFSPKHSGETFLAFGSENLWDAREDAGRALLQRARRDV